MPVKQKVYCYETKKEYSCQADACKEMGFNKGSLGKVVNKPNRALNGLHFCTDLKLFDNVIFPKMGGSIVYCWETKQVFPSLIEAAKFCGLTKNGIRHSIDSPINTAGGYHWCTNLDVFKEVDFDALPTTNKPYYCFETKQRFNTLQEGATFANLVSPADIQRALKSPEWTAAGYHFCYELDGFIPRNQKTVISSHHQQLTDLLETDFAVLNNSRSLLGNKQEVDLYLEEYKLGVEFNGNYWHQEKLVGHDYHIKKTNFAKNVGIELIHIFEHQFTESNHHLWLSLIKNKCRKNQRIHARKCTIVELDNVSEFLNTNHIQSNCQSSIKLGLEYNNELVAVMTFGNPRFNKNIEWELLRFCSKAGLNVVGGASKLLTYFERKYLPTSMISYANLQWSTGGLYSKLGFTLLNQSAPNYWWCKDKITLSRYKCQKHKLSTLFPDYMAGESERSCMERHGYYRVFDCGNLVFTKAY